MNRDRAASSTVPGSRRARPGRAWLVLLLLGAGTVARAGDLDAAQTQRLAALTSSTRQIETNLALAEQAAGAGDGPLAPAKARLVKTRLAQPAAQLPQVRELLAELPADHPEVVALKARLDAGAASIARLETRLGAKEAAPAPGAGRKLDWPQEKALADGRSYVREVLGLAAALDEVSKEIAAAPDAGALDHRRLATAMNTVVRARERAVLARNHLDALPADGAGVVSALDELAAALVSVAGSEATLKPVHERLQALVNPGTWPDLEADVRGLSALGQMYGEPAHVFAADRARAARLVAELPATVVEHERLATLYAPLVRQQTEAARRIEGAGRFCAERLAAFATTVTAQRAKAPVDLEAAFAELARNVQTAVAEKKPAYFTGGIPQALHLVEEQVALLAALDAEAGKAAQQRLETVRAALKEQQASLAQQIADGNEMPPDRYAGPDRPELERAATEAWLKVEPKAEVRKVRIPSSAWQRETMWRRQGTTWYRIDRSRIQVQLLVKRDGSLAVIRPVELWIDHQAGDTRTAVPMDAPKDPVEPQRLLRLDRLQ